jgi:hypothetical protein
VIVAAGSPLGPIKPRSLRSPRGPVAQSLPAAASSRQRTICLPQVALPPRFASAAPGSEREGLRCYRLVIADRAKVWVEIDAAIIEFLIATYWLDEATAGDRRAIGAAPCSRHSRTRQGGIRVSPTGRKGSGLPTSKRTLISD